jgi:hypothetical protein
VDPSNWYAHVNEGFEGFVGASTPQRLTDEMLSKLMQIYRASKSLQPENMLSTTYPGVVSPKITRDERRDLQPLLDFSNKESRNYVKTAFAALPGHFRPMIDAILDLCLGTRPKYVTLHFRFQTLRHGLAQAFHLDKQRVMSYAADPDVILSILKLPGGPDVTTSGCIDLNDGTPFGCSTEILDGLPTLKPPIFMKLLDQITLSTSWTPVRRRNWLAKQFSNATLEVLAAKWNDQLLAEAGMSIVPMGNGTISPQHMRGFHRASTRPLNKTTMRIFLAASPSVDRPKDFVADHTYVDGIQIMFNAI